MIEGLVSPTVGAVLAGLSVTLVLLGVLVYEDIRKLRADAKIARNWFWFKYGFSVSVRVDLDLATFRNGLDDYIRRAWAYKPPDLAVPRWSSETDRHTVEIFDVPPGLPTDKKKPVIELRVSSPLIDDGVIVSVRCLSPSAAAWAFDFVLSLPLVLRPADEWITAKKTQAPEAVNGDTVDLSILTELKPSQPGLERWRFVPVDREIINRRKRVLELSGLGWTYEEIAKELTVSVDTVKKDLQALGLTKPRRKRRR